MRVSIIDKQGLLSSEAISNTESKVRSSLEKFGNDVMSVRVTFQDVNGPRGGIDKECRVLVRSRKINDVRVSSKQASLSKAIPFAIARAARSVGRLIEKRQSRSGVSNLALGLQ